MHDARHLALRLAAPLLVAALGAACDTSELPSSGSQVTELRVLAVQADPPVALFGEPIRVCALVADASGAVEGPSETYGWTWDLCLVPGAVEDPTLRCFEELALGTELPKDEVLAPDGACVDVDVLSLLTAAADAGIDLEGVTDGTTGDTTEPLDTSLTLDLWLSLSVRASSTDSAVACGTAGASCTEAGRFLKLVLDAEQTHGNPTLDALDGDGQPIPDQDDVWVTAGANVGLTPVWTPSVAIDRLPGGGTEPLLFRWYTTGGTFQLEATEAGDSTNRWSAPATPGDVTVWVVSRDGRGGVSWLQRRLRVE